MLRNLTFLNRLWPAIPLLSICVAVAARPQGKPEDLQKEAYDRGIKSLTAVEKALQGAYEIERLRVGKDIRTSSGYGTYTPDYVDTVLSAIKDAKEYHKRIDDAWKAYQQKKSDSGAFYATLYDSVYSGIRYSWGCELNSAGSGNLIYYAQVSRLEDKLQPARSAFEDGLAKRDDLTSDEKKALLAEFDRKQDLERKALFDEIVAPYRETVLRLSTHRKAYLEDLTAWQALAGKRHRVKDDVHWSAAESFKKAEEEWFSPDAGARMPTNLAAFGYYPGSKDRLVTGYNTQDWARGSAVSDIVYDDSPGVLRMFGIAKDPSQAVKITPRNVAIQVAWTSSTAAGMTYTLTEFQDKKVLPVQYKPKVEVTLAVTAKDYRAGDHPKLISLEIKNLNGGMGIVYPPEQVACDFDSSGKALIKLSGDKLLDDVKSEINQDVLEAKIKIDYDGTVMQSTSDNVMHLLRQKLILFIPGVCGSEIWVSAHPDEKAFLAMSKDINPFGTQPARWLECKRDGTPKPGFDAVKLDLLRSYAVATVYDVENQPSVTGGLHLIRNADGVRMDYYWVQPWAYDWRLRLEGAVQRLAGSGQGKGGVVPPYESPPSLADVLAGAKQNHPFLDDKIAVVGHSTGGLITRGLLCRSDASGAAKQFVDHAYFVDTPFWGAPKVYHVFLTGEDMVPIIANSMLRELAPNLPIVYYLAPSKQLPGTLMYVKGRKDSVGQEYRRTSGTSAGDFMEKLIRVAREEGDYPKASEIEPWNASLEQAADAYHDSIKGAPAIGWDHCLVFVSDQGKDSTRMTVAVAPLKNGGAPVINCWKSFGDGTVPLVSQVADAPAARVKKIPNAPVHADAANQSYVWAQIIHDLQKRSN